MNETFIIDVLTSDGIEIIEVDPDNTLIDVIIQGPQGPQGVTPAVNTLECIVFHDGSTGGGTRPNGYARVRWVGGISRPTNMLANDAWEHDA